MSNVTIAARPSTGQSIGEWFTSHWFATFAIVYGLWIWLPWLAPVMMQFEQSEAGKAIYFVYSLFCHQLPERSFFLFGPQTMYSLSDIQAAWQTTLSPMVLRRFIGNDAMGWKVAWSDRMVSFYTTVWLTAIAWWPLRRKIRPLPWWGFALMLLPMVLDGVTHAASDFNGLGRGFRDSNDWLLALTENSLPLAYAGDALGSFNSWARLLTGILAGLGITWFAFPHLERSFAQD
ncbi:MAG: DUF2085 domain-containing protein [Chloroflexota bacterium]